jgi:hypothetical protein
MQDLPPRIPKSAHIIADEGCFLKYFFQAIFAINMVIGYSLSEIGKFMVNILAIHGSPRYNGNTSSLLEQAVMGARDEGAIVEEIDIK